MKKCKKLLSVILSICMLLSITAGLNLTALATSESDFDYRTRNDERITYRRYIGSETTVNIPYNSEISYIEGDAFKGCTTVKKIIFPKNIEGIASYDYDDNRFYNEHLILPDTVNSLEVVSDNPYLDSRDNCNAIVETATNKLISGCQSTIIPNTVTEIGEYAFAECTNLTSIKFNESVVSIDTGAFLGCNKLTHISIPKSITKLAESAFEGCTNITSLSVDSENKVFDSRDNCNAIIETKSNTLYIGCQNTVVPDSVTSIGDGAFLECSNLESLAIPEGVSTIGVQAFYWCTNLKNITIPKTVKKIGISSFFKCDTLADVYYNGTVSQWKAIDINSYNETLNAATVHCTDGTITGENNAPATKKSIAKATVSGVKAKTCTGKALTQSVTVKLGNTTLKNGTDYTVSYKNNKNVGTATVTVTGKGNYEGTVSKSFKINPKATTLSKVSAKKKGFTAKWKKQSKQTTGYQLQYATNSKFKKAKSVTVKSNKTVSVTQKSLKAKKKYYVRIRTYKTVNGKKYYSDWSKAKTVTTKK